MNPRVSVIVPAYRCADTVEETVRSALNGTMQEIELIAVDDGSGDGTAAVLERLRNEDARVRVIALPENAGVANARNTGVKEAKADWIAFLDSDDVWEADKLARQLETAERTGASLVYTAAACVDETGAMTGKLFSVPETVTANGLLKGNDLITSTVLVKKTLAAKHPMERSDLHEDLICWYGILKDGAKAVGIDEPLVRYRVSKGSKSGDKKKSARMTWNTYKHLGIGVFRRIGCFIGYCLHGIKRYWL
ncbi:MAG: glycosyltransferase family 2 protein [Clostridia bacterium]|nr:glycosyltransferase family 2 protein [Clostridia bacterium]